MDEAREALTIDEVESRMRDYTSAWNAEDVDAIEAFYHLPYFSYQEGALTVWIDATESRDADLQWIEVNRRHGPATWERLESTVLLQGRNGALVTTRWVYRRTAGDDVWDFVDTFVLCRIGGSLQFVGRIVHD